MPCHDDGHSEAVVGPFRFLILISKISPPVAQSNGIVGVRKLDIVYFELIVKIFVKENGNGI